jgi:hypothetical protein
MGLDGGRGFDRLIEDGGKRDSDILIPLAVVMDCKCWWFVLFMYHRIGVLDLG